MRWQDICAAAVGLWAGLALASAASAQSRTGIVLVHGKQGSEHNLQSLADALTAAGYAVERPEMCWSRRRIYDRAVPRLPARHRRRGGTAARGRAPRPSSSPGRASAAMRRWAYGARRDGLLGVIAMAPAPAMEFISRRPDIGESVAKARQMVAQGLGELRAVFKDVNLGEAFEVATTANIYLTFLSPELARRDARQRREAESAPARGLRPVRFNPAQRRLCVRPRAIASAELARDAAHQPSRYARCGARDDAVLAQAARGRRPRN